MLLQKLRVFELVGVGWNAAVDGEVVVEVVEIFDDAVAPRGTGLAADHAVEE